MIRSIVRKIRAAFARPVQATRPAPAPAFLATCETREQYVARVTLELNCDGLYVVAPRG